MKIDLIKELPILVKAGVISQESADNITGFYQNKGAEEGSNRLFIVFGIVGAILVGLGIILIIAHNWDDLSRAAKVTISFLPLLTGQIFCAYSLIKKNESPAWKESSAVFLFFAVGASISLISQIYNIPGSFTSFMTTWMLLALPLVYVMKSSLVSLLYLIGITSYACEKGYFHYPATEPYLYGLMLTLVLPHYFLLLKNKPKSNFTSFHNWFVPLSLIVVLGSFSENHEEFLFISYFALFGLLFSLGSYNRFSELRLVNNGLLVLGSLGSIVLLTMLSFDWFWVELTNDVFRSGTFSSPEFLLGATLFVTASAVVWKRSGETAYRFDPKEFIYAVFLIVFLSGIANAYVAVLLINLLLFVLGVTTIRKGIRLNHLGILNYGLLIITALIVSRFFDSEISFVVRGLLFVIVGIGFFVANHLLLKKRKSQNG